MIVIKQNNMIDQQQIQAQDNIVVIPMEDVTPAYDEETAGYTVPVSPAMYNDPVDVIEYDDSREQRRRKFCVLGAVVMAIVGIVFLVIVTSTALTAHNQIKGIEEEWKPPTNNDDIGFPGSPPDWHKWALHRSLETIYKSE